MDNVCMFGACDNGECDRCRWARLLQWWLDYYENKPRCGVNELLKVEETRGELEMLKRGKDKNL